MDANIACKLSGAKDYRTVNKVKKTINKAYKEIAKAVRRGKYYTWIPAWPFCMWGSSISFEDYQGIVREHFTDCGFEVESDINRFEVESDINRTIKISWKPANLVDRFRVCTPKDKLRHLVLTGEVPRVLVGEEDE